MTPPASLFATSSMTAQAARLHPRTWRPAAVIWFSLALHAVCLLIVFLEPSAWGPLAAAVAANHLGLTALGLWPRSRWLGENHVVLPAGAKQRAEIALTFDDGPDPAVTPAVLDCLDRYAARASFFCIAQRALMHPELIQEIVRRGHSVENHSLCHPHAFACYGPVRMQREIESAETTLTRLAGAPPRFFRAPAGLRNPFLDPILARTGLRYISWTRRGFDTREREPERVLARLTRKLAPGDVLLLHDGSAARTRAGEPVVLAVLPGLLEAVRAHRLVPVSLPEAFDMEPAAVRSGPGLPAPA